MPALPTILLILAAFSFGAAAIAALVALRSGREAKSAIFPIIKEEETIKARRARVSIIVWLAITALFVGGWLASLQLTAPPAEQADQPTPTETAVPVIAAAPTETPAAIAPSPTLAAGNTPVPTATPFPPTVTPTPVPPTVTHTPSPMPPTATSTATQTPTSTATATVTPPPTATPITRMPVVNRTPAPPGVRMGPIQFGADITADLTLVNPGKIFPADTQKIYAIYPFKGVPKDVNFTIVWYKNGAEFSRDTTPWEYGETAASYTFTTVRGPGLYKLNLYINDTVVATNMFEIR